MNKILITFFSIVVSLGAKAQTSSEIDINPSTTYQSIRSFGASDCWTADYVGRYFSDSEKEKAARWLFSSETDAKGNPLGIALSQWRVNLGAGSSTQGDNSNISDKTRRTDCFLSASGKTYDWTHAEGQQWFMKEAKSYGVPQFLLFSNAPLIYYTTNGLANNKDNKSSGSILKIGCYDDFADYLAECTSHFTALGYNIAYLDPVNEPAFDWADGQEGTPWANVEIARFVKQLDKSITAKNLSTQILIPEASAWDRLYQQCSDYNGRASNQIEAFWNKANTNTYIGDLQHLAPIAAAHSYWTYGTDADLVNVRTKVAEATSTYGLEAAQTEWSLLGDAPASSTGFPSSYDLAGYMDLALYMAKMIYADLVYANVSSWSYWTAMAQEQWSQKNRFYLLRLNATGDTGKESYGDIQKGGTVTDSKNLWVLGNYSRFVRPGYTRVAMTIPDTKLTGLMGTAFLSPKKDTVVAVFVNYGSVRSNISFNIDGYKVLSTDTYTTDATHNLSHATLAQGDKLSLAKKTVTTVVMKVDNATGIKNVATVKGKKNARVYNLSGQTVNSKHFRGVCIVDGKKIIRK